MVQRNKKLTLNLPYLTLIIGLLFIISSCETVKQQGEVSLKGKKITESFMQTLNKSIYISNDTTNAFEVYELNTNSPKAKIVEKELASILKNSQNKLSKQNVGLNDLREPTLESGGDPNMDDAVIVEENETGRDILVTPINYGDDTRNRITFSGYNETTNSIEKIITYTAQGNYKPDIVENNPSLAEQAELTFTFESETGETLLSGTLNSENHNFTYGSSNWLKNSNIASDINPFTCFGNCFKNGLDNLSWWNEYLCMAAGLGCIYAIAQGCWTGCWSAWLWNDVLGF